ncbi:unnamed protein product [Amoebophrya sp. A120]|nr:unnamed protein product [Amoebophrya sp. A120]|eukprot:GSA120T00004063001.1
MLSSGPPSAGNAISELFAAAANLPTTKDPAAEQRHGNLDDELTPEQREARAKDPLFDNTVPEAIRCGAQWAEDDEKKFVDDDRERSSFGRSIFYAEVDYTDEADKETYGITDQVKKLTITDSFKNKFEVKPYSTNVSLAPAASSSSTVQEQMPPSTAHEPFFHAKQNKSSPKKTQAPELLWTLTWTPGAIDKYQTATIKSHGRFPGKNLQNRTIRNLSQSLPSKQQKVLRKEDFEIVRHAFSATVGTEIGTYSTESGFSPKCISERKDVDPGTDAFAGKIMVNVTETGGFSDKAVMLDELSESATKLIMLLTKMVEAA